MSEKAYWLAARSSGLLSGKSFERLLAAYGSIEAAWRDRGSLTTILPARQATEFARLRRKADPKRIAENLGQAGIKTVILTEPTYPELLKQIPDPPPVLYYRGELTARPTAAIVGSRTPTEYGLAVARDFAEELSLLGVCVISGLAFGIDAAAHAAALATGITWAVLPGGVEDPQPKANAHLAAQILAAGGALISEFPPGSPVRKENFPLRNRLISGLAHVTVIIEGAGGSGALITARAALDQNRPVLAVPGSIYSVLSEGPNRLIVEGATPALTVEDIVRELPFGPVRVPQKEESDPLLILLGQPRSIDELAAVTGADTAEIAQALTLLELESRVTLNESGRYIIKR